MSLTREAEILWSCWPMPQELRREINSRPERGWTSATSSGTLPRLASVILRAERGRGELLHSAALGGVWGGVPGEAERGWIWVVVVRGWISGRSSSVDAGTKAAPGRRRALSVVPASALALAYSPPSTKQMVKFGVGSTGGHFISRARGASCHQAPTALQLHSEATCHISHAISTLRCTTLPINNLVLRTPSRKLCPLRWMEATCW